MKRFSASDVERLAITMWGFHPALWIDASTGDEKRHYRRKAWLMLERMDDSAARYAQYLEYLKRVGDTSPRRPRAPSSSA